MKTRLLIIAGVSVVVFLIGAIVYPHINETTFEDYSSHDIKSTLDVSTISDPMCFEIETASVTAGRWEPVTIQNEDCDDAYDKSISQNRSIFPLHGNQTWKPMSPLKQTEYGIPNDMIRCYDGLILIHKYDGTPACVKEQSIPKLIERGWIKDKMQHLCEKFSGNWNKDYATCFDFSDDYDCESMGGKLEGRAYTDELPDYSKKSHSFVCEFRK